jgi:hypothetical protein
VQRPSTPNCDCRRFPAPASKSRNSSSLTGEKRGNLHHNKNTQGVTFPAYPSLRKIAGATGEKIQNLNYRGIGIKTLIKDNSRCRSPNEE